MSAFAFLSNLVPAVLQLALLMIFVRRRLYREFLLFFAYTLYSILVSALRLWSMTPVAFFVVYWTTEMIYGLLALLAILEVFRPTLESYFGHLWSRWVLPLALLIVSLISLWRAAYHPMGHTKMARFAAGSYAFMLGVLCLEVIVFAVCLRLRSRRPYPVRWGRYRLGIIAGFGLSACASASAYLVRFIFGSRFEAVFHYVLPGAYIGATLIWLIAFFKPEPPLIRNPTDPDMLRRATDSLTEATEEARKDLGFRMNCLFWL